MARRQKYLNRHDEYVAKKAKTIKSIFTLLGVCALLFFINKGTSPFDPWSKVPIMAIFGVIALQVFKLIGLRISARIEERHLQSQYDARPQDSFANQITKPYTQDDKLELRDMNAPTKEKVVQKQWKDSDLV